MSDYYCSEKFWWMYVNLEKRTLSACCSATGVDVDPTWMKQNPGELFNHPSLVSDRQLMLENKPCASCHHTCWSQENKGLESKRTRYNREIQTHKEIKSKPEVVNIHIGSSCNMSCTYCGVHSSTTWANDVIKHGSYNVTGDTRFTTTQKDIVIMKLGQKATINSKPYLEMLHEVKMYDDADSMDLTGGEPFLHNNLETIIEGFRGRIRIHTGLGVDSNRLEKLLNKLPLDRIRITVSTENIGDLYEFNRYGNSYDRFLRNLDLLKTYNLPITFRSTLSNLTIFGYKDFLDKFSDYTVSAQSCTNIDYLSMHVLDPISKQKILNTDYGKDTALIHGSIIEEPTELDKHNLKMFLTDFAKRRELSLDVFPETFVEWISQ